MNTKEELTNHQLGPILAILRELQPFLLEEPVSSGETPTASALDGEVSAAAELTFIKACDRMNAILDDEARWTIKPHTDAIAEIVKTQKAQQKFLAAQTATTEQMQAPHFLLKPSVAIMGENYVAFWGDISKPGEAICGVGRTPQEALLDFDKAFNRAPNEQVVIIAEKAGLDLNNTEPPTKSE